MTARTFAGLIAIAAMLLGLGCEQVEMPRVANEKEVKRLFAPAAMLTPLPAPPGPPGWDDPKGRAELIALLDGGEDVHDACITVGNSGDMAAVPHLIRALRQFGDKEPAPRDGIVCTWDHCVRALEQITGAHAGYTAKSWQLWYGRKTAAPPAQR